jgi:hypothetical protein
MILWATCHEGMAALGVSGSVQRSRGYPIRMLVLVGKEREESPT